MEIRTVKNVQKILSDYNIVFINKYPFLSTPKELYTRKVKVICNTREGSSLSIKKYYNIIGNNLDLGERDIIQIINNYKKDNYGRYIHMRNPRNLIESFCEEKNIKLIANKQKIIEKVENKKNFRNVLREIGIPQISGENITVQELIVSKYKHRNKYGKKIVIQLPDIKQGGGKGTFFINNENEFKKIQKILYKGIYRNTDIHSININKYIDGVSASIACCITKYGTITTNLQTQIIDADLLSKSNENKGIFCGHDRGSYTYSKTAQIKAQIIGEKIGSYMYKLGYRGIFGIDYIVNGEDIYCVECNPRITAAFPIVSLIDLDRGLIPLESFHLLELININYKIDFEKINRMYKYKRKGSHIIVKNIKDKKILCKKTLPIGTYRYSSNKLVYINNLLDYKLLKKNEYIIVNGNPRKGDIIKIQGRICQIITKDNVLQKKTLTLKKTSLSL